MRKYWHYTALMTMIEKYIRNDSSLLFVEFVWFYHFNCKYLACRLLFTTVNYWKFAYSNFIPHIIQLWNWCSFVIFEMSHPLLLEFLITEVECSGLINSLTMAYLNTMPIVFFVNLLCSKPFKADNQNRVLEIILLWNNQNWMQKNQHNLFSFDRSKVKFSFRKEIRLSVDK